MVREAFEAMRSAQSRRPARQRLLWNRLLLYAWPTIEIRPEEAGAVIARFARETAGLGPRAGHAPRAHARGRRAMRDRALRMFNPAGRGVVVEVTDPPTQPLQPLDEGAQRIVSARRRGTLHPAEIVKILAPQRAHRGAAIPAGEFVEHDLDDDGELVPVDRPAATNAASVVVGLIRNRTERYPEGMLRVVAARRPDPVARLAGRARVPPDHRRARPRRAARRAVRVVRALLRREDRDGLRHREHGLGRGGAAAHRALHAGGRRDQRRRERHQRRRPAVLQRRGDDAHAHQGHPRDDARQRDGAHRQAGARLLRRRLGGGQLRHRRLRPRDGAQRPGAVLGARPRRRVRGAAALLRAHLRGAGRALPAAGRERPTRSTATSRARRTRRRTPTCGPSARSSPRRPTRAARSRSTSAR